METIRFRRVYVWELPVRIFHWINAFALTILAVSGFIISNPPALLSNAEASDIYWFGIVRVIHFATAYIFLFVMVMRIYWAFVGNKFSRWSAFWPFTSKMFHNFWHVLKVDILLKNKKQRQVNDISVGHNSIAALSYAIMFFIAIVQIITGFGLYAANATWWLPKSFAWVVPLFGSDFLVRTIHHVSSWVFIVFVLIHVYLVFYHDWLEGRGEVSSMFGGYKFVNEERLKKEKLKEKEAAKAVS